MAPKASLKGFIIWLAAAATMLLTQQAWSLVSLSQAQTSDAASAAALLGAAWRIGVAALLCATATLVLAVWIARQSRALARERHTLRLNEKRLWEITNYRQQFLASMSHEFRTPLNAVKGFAELTLMRVDSISKSELSENLTIINQSSEDLLTLIEQALDISRLDANAYTLNEEVFNLNDLLHEAVESFAARAAEAGVMVTIDALQTPDVRADRAALRRCVGNLVENAVKFSANGQEVRVVYDHAAGGARITVVDQGCGIPPDELNEIWGFYARSGMTRESDRQGAGFGLALTKALIERHGGDIRLYSAVGQGVAAVLTLPESRIAAPEERCEATPAVQPDVNANSQVNQDAPLNAANN